MATAWITCPQDRDNTSLPRSSPCPKLEVQLVHQVLERLIFRQVHGVDQLLITEYHQSSRGTVMDTVNPFCRKCQDEIVDYFRYYGYGERYSPNVLQAPREKVEKKCGEKIDCDCVLPCKVVTQFSRVLKQYDEEVLTAWRERVSFIEGYTGKQGVSIEALKRSIIQDNEDTICVICLEELNKEEAAVKKMMPCKHEFHEGCIDEWLHNSHFCPICRFEMPATEDNSSN